MATLKAVVMADDKRLDGTYNVKIRLTHNRSTVRIKTNIYVDSSQLTRSLKLKDQMIIDACEHIIFEWRGLIAKLGTAADSMTAKELSVYLKQRGKDTKGFRLDFVQYMRKVGDEKRAGNTRNNYITAANALQRFHGKDALDISDVTAVMLRNFERWLAKEDVSQGSIHLYMSLIKAAHNSAKSEYNDEDGGIIRVPQSPFSRYKVPALPAPQPRGVDLATLQRIADLPDEARINSRLNNVRDIFMLSFALGGMNAVDMYSLPYSAYKGEYIEYNRRKTKNARADKALYRVHIHPLIRPLLERHIDPAKKRLFRFYHRSESEQSFVVSIPYSMKRIEELVPFGRHYVFYAARHTYASLARNMVGVDKYTIHELLNHSDAQMKITDRYIERDWQRLFDAHDKVVELIDWTKICEER